MKSLFQLLLIALFFVSGLQKAFASETLKITPGKSLGAVSLGEERAKLIDKGFGPDGATDPQKFLQMSGVLVRLKDDKVAQIYADTKALKRLRFKGKKLPKDTSAKAIKKFFAGCGRQIKTAVGILMYCEHHGVELTYHAMKGQLEGLAIVTAKPVKGKKAAKSQIKALPKKVVKKPKKALPQKMETPELDESSLEKDIEAMPSDNATPPEVAPADTPVESSAAPTGKELEKANDLPYED